MSSRREFLLAMVLVPLGLRPPNNGSFSVNSQVPCWDCGEVLFDDEQEAREVAAGLQCWTCFEFDTQSGAEQWKLHDWSDSKGKPRWNSPGHFGNPGVCPTCSSFPGGL